MPTYTGTPGEGTGMRSLIVRPIFAVRVSTPKATGRVVEFFFMTNGALVLAGGGVAGIAWETGVLLGIQDMEREACARIIGAPTTLIGTSAGSTTAAQLSGGTSLQALYDAQIAEETGEIFVEVNLVEFGAMMAGA